MFMYIFQLSTSTVSFPRIIRSSSHLILFMIQAEHADKGKIAQLKSLGSEAVERKDFLSASGFYTKVY